MSSDNNHSPPGSVNQLAPDRDTADIQSLRYEAASRYRAGRLADLEPICRQILSLDSDDANALHLLGLSLKAKGDENEASISFQQAAEAAPDNKAFIIAAANAQLNQGEFPGAIKCLENFLTLQPSSIDAYNNIGYCYLALGRTKDAINAYKNALQIEPDHAHTLNNMGNAFQEFGRKNIAVEFYKKAIRVNPDFEKAYYNLHAVVFNEENPGKSIAALRTATEINPNNIEAKAYLAMLLDISGQSKESNRLFQEIMDEARNYLYLIDSWEYVRSHRSHSTRLFTLTFDALRHAFTHSKAEGLILEFGVRHGITINFISRKTKSIVHGFDSFEGLPDEWEGTGKGAYTTYSELPKVQSNVQLHQGWFEDTLPSFCKNNSGKVGFMNVDCDLYNSTRTIFEHLGKQIQSGSVIVFDEYICNPHWRNDEYRAFQEYVNENNLRYEYLLFSPFSKQAAVVIK